MKKTAIFLLLTISIFSHCLADINNLLNSAYEKAIKGDLKDLYKLSFSSYNEGLYNIAEKKCIEFLKKSNDNLKKAYILELLSKIYYRTKNIWAMENIVLKNTYLLRDKIPIEVQKSIFVNAYNLALKKGKDLKSLKSRFSYLLKNKKGFTIPAKLKKFTPNVNIFKYKKGNILGENRIYFSSKDQTFYEIGYITDTGYDELREANPLLNPFDVRKGMAILIPRKRILPAKKVNFGEIYINLVEKRLYYPIEENKEKYIITFPIGIGTDNTKSPVGTFTITQKRKNPMWYVPKNIKEENPDLPDVVPAGENNPLGTRAMRLDTSTYLIHGTNKNFGVGLKVSHGCIRLFNRDIERLFEIVPSGTKVHIYEKFLKTTYINGKKYIELHGRLNELRNFKPSDRIDSVFWNYIKKEKRGYAIPLDLLP